MAGMVPFFLTGANAKIRLNDKTLAFCTDMAYTIQVNHVAPKVLGVYEATSLEPLSYSVSGTFTIIKYAAELKELVSKAPDGVSNDGNGLGSWGPGNPFKAAGFGNDGRAHQNLDPSKLQTGTFFDIEIWQKTSVGNCFIAKIRDCRITQADFSIAKNTPGIQRFTFQAIYADEDTFKAGISGTGQQFQ